MIRVGIAGWANPVGERKRRPATRSHLSHFATQFDFVEINSSFYRPHQRATYERWRLSTPSTFQFSVKLPRTVTHECALRNCRLELRRFLAEIGGLGEKLRVLLVQLPPSLPFELRVATRFFNSLSSGCTSLIACEPRHHSWFTERADALFRRHDVARVAVDPAIDPIAKAPGGSKRFAYYRLHGSPRMYYSSYSAAYLRALAMQMKGSREAKDIWCAFDNTARQASWPNAKRLLRLLAE